MKTNESNNIIYSKEDIIEWSDLSIIREKLNGLLLNNDVNINDTDAIVMIVNEFLENICKYTEEKKVNLLLVRKKQKNNTLQITVENPVKDFRDKKLILFIKDIKRINSYDDIDKLLYDSILISSKLNQSESKLGLPLIRKIAKGSKITLLKSKKYSPGIIIKINFKLQ